jgi:hypothetical protein
MVHWQSAYVGKKQARKLAARIAAIACVYMYSRYRKIHVLPFRESERTNTAFAF